MTTTDKMAAELRELRQSVTDLAHRMRRSGASQVDRASEGIGEVSADVLRSGGRALDDLERRLGRLERDVSRTVREHPKAVFGGLAGVIVVGVLLALLFRREE